MFIDEILEEHLINKGETLAVAFFYVCEDKLANKEDWNFTTIKRLENGYQLFRKKHEGYPEHSFRTYVRLLSPELAKAIGWK